MDLVEKMRQLWAGIDRLRSDKSAQDAAALPDGGYFLDEDTVLCLERERGDARYPYAADGFNLWAFSSGYMSINESTFYVVLSSDGGREPYLNFYAGLPDKKGRFTPVSLTGIARSFAEGEAERCTVFTPQAVYYLTRTGVADFVVRAYVTEDKDVRFSIAAEAKQDSEIYISGYFYCFLMHASAEYNEAPWFRQSKTSPCGFVFHSVEDLDRKTHLDNYGILNRKISADVTGLYSTTSRSDYTGGKHNYMAASPALFAGRFSECKQATKFTDTAVAGDIIHVRLRKGQSARVDYGLSVCADEKAKDALLKRIPDAREYDGYVGRAEKADRARKADPFMLKMEFGESEIANFRAEIFEKFTGFVQRQVEFAALSKNSGVSLLGIRDVFQQLEAALMWAGGKCRAKIVEALGFTGEDGRVPRQYSIPPSPDVPPQMDLRKFIDQGAWIIDTVYRYLAYTGDYTILDEECGYYNFERGIVRTGERTSVLEHLLRICRFFVSEIDAKTDCLHVLYGDWNDALDGMGVSEDPSREFGTGVSVMATLQLRRNMIEMREILRKIGKQDLLPTREIQKRLESGLEKYAIVTDGESRRILHGWGDGRSYLVGSACDPDGKDRVGLTSYAFWVISGMYERDPSIRAEILRAYGRLDSKYGLRTFDKYFEPKAPGVGRIGNLPPGTAENSATYVHAAMFGIWSLFMMGEGEAAWDQLRKVLPFTHEHLSTTQFVMSNSYSLNEEFGMDGESMSDWYTGAANVLIKVLVRCVFGVDASLSGVRIMPADSLPFRSMKIRVNVRGCSLRVEYEKEGKGGGDRSFFVNGRAVVPEIDTLSGNAYILLDETVLKAETVTISVKD